MQILVMRVVDRLINMVVDLIYSFYPGYRLRKIETEIASLDRAIDKELMMSSPKESTITELETKLSERKADRARILKQ